MGRYLPCELKGKHSQQEIPSFGAFLKIEQPMYVSKPPVHRPERSVAIWPAGIELCLSGRSERV